MRASKKTYVFTSAYIELLHDEALELFWPDLEPVSSKEYRDKGAIDSALSAPFQTFDGVPLVPDIRHRGAHLFHSLIASHPFTNGNKRTAILALEMFLRVNSHFLSAPPGEMHSLAAETACYRERGWRADQMIARIASVVVRSAIPFQELSPNDRGTSEQIRAFLRSLPSHLLRRL